MKKVIGILIAMMVVVTIIPTSFAASPAADYGVEPYAATSTTKYDSKGNAFKTTGSCSKSGTLASATTSFKVTNYALDSGTLNGVKATCAISAARVTLSNGTVNTNSGLIGSGVITCSDKVTSGKKQTSASFTTSISGVLCTHNFNTNSGISKYSLSSAAT